MSGRKNILHKFQVMTSADGSGDITSAVTGTQYLDNIGYQINLSGTPTMTGQFFVQVSVDYEQNAQGTVTNAGNWVSLSLSPTASVTGGSPSTIYIDINQISAPWMRLIYTHSSGTGTVNAFVSAKGL